MDAFERLKNLKEMMDSGMITEEEFNQLKKPLLEQITTGNAPAPSPTSASAAVTRSVSISYSSPNNGQLGVAGVPDTQKPIDIKSTVSLRMAKQITISEFLLSLGFVIYGFITVKLYFYHSFLFSLVLIIGVLGVSVGLIAEGQKKQSVLGFGFLFISLFHLLFSLENIFSMAMGNGGYKLSFESLLSSFIITLICLSLAYMVGFNKTALFIKFKWLLFAFSLLASLVAASELISLYNDWTDYYLEVYIRRAVIILLGGVLAAFILFFDKKKKVNLA